ncbi:CRISPR-associated protein Csx16 [Photobacterium carnosum]|uniref:CRISPR-associated protein Csx16 n=1 Tax=Photobacterium carnosum TaxID=2023717 RepID=UPI001E63BAC6|nr:CRISPR-associated protein Csx16 [Photobacterium carnosum]MCD9527529.1 CRISPR-associated protein Csx16 [Photobacterium carnosum]
MATYFISRHPAALEWVKQQNVIIDHCLRHLLDMSLFTLGDVVLGTFPIQLVAALNKKGIKYGHFSLTVPPQWRGMELDLAQILQCQPEISYFHVEKIEGTDNLTA